MEYKFNFQTEAEKLELIHENKDKYIKEIAHCFDGQYIIFTDEKISSEPSEIDILKEEQKQQNEEILVNMMANAETFEMILGMMPVQINTSTKTINPMISVYVTLYTKGLKEIDDVPLAIREQFVERLNELNISIR